MELYSSNKPGGITVSVILDPAEGAIALHLMLYFLPSIAKVLLSPTRPSLAENYKMLPYIYVIIINTIFNGHSNNKLTKGKTIIQI